MKQQKGPVTIHYMDFIAELGGIFPLSDLIDGKYFYKLKATDKQLAQLLKYISKKDMPGRFYETVARLYIKFDNEEIFVTCDGRVKRGADEYLMAPQHFLRLSYYLEMLKVKNGIKEGVPKFY
ncbi:MAG: hypothetical protein QM758_06225 [Armatimonas sp.]